MGPSRVVPAQDQRADVHLRPRAPEPPPWPCPWCFPRAASALWFRLWSPPFPPCVLEMEPEASHMLTKCPASEPHPRSVISICAAPWDQLQSFLEDEAHVCVFTSFLKVSDVHPGAELIAVGRTHPLPRMHISWSQPDLSCGLLSHWIQRRGRHPLFPFLRPSSWAHRVSHSAKAT